MNKYITSFNQLITIGFFLLILISMVNNFYPRKTYEFKGIVIETPHVPQGGNVIFHVDFCKHTDKAVTSSRVLRKTDLTYISPAPVLITASPVGCRTVKTATQIPEEAPPGVYVVESTQVVKFGNRERTTSYRTPEFTVTEATKAAERK